MRAKEDFIREEYRATRIEQQGNVVTGARSTTAPTGMSKFVRGSLT
jgi:hypothetical protein